MSLHVRTATPDDLDALIKMRVAIEDRLHAAGIDQWHNRDRGIRNLREGVQAGTTHVVVDPAGTVVATLTLSGPDSDWWRKSDNPDSALYLYKFMITDPWRGSGLGEEMLDWACQQAQKQGKEVVRLDCWRTNTKLHEYYKQRGFYHVRTDIKAGRGSGALFERPAAVRTASTRHLEGDATSRAA